MTKPRDECVPKRANPAHWRILQQSAEQTQHPIRLQHKQLCECEMAAKGADAHLIALRNHIHPLLSLGRCQPKLAQIRKLPGNGSHWRHRPFYNGVGSRCAEAAVAIEDENDAWLAHYETIAV